MNSNDYSAPPSNSNIYQRSPSLDTTTPTTYTPAPNISSVQFQHSDRQIPATSLLSDQAPGFSGVRGTLNSSNLISTNREGNSYSTSVDAYKASPGMSDLVRNNISENNNGVGVGVSQQKQPNFSDVVGQRDKSTNGGETAAEKESIDPRDYVGISLVGRKFKQVNPEAYYVEKDE